MDDNFHYMDKSERYKLGDFEDCQRATAACKAIVDRFLASVSHDCTAEELFKQYTSFGEDPWIASDDRGCQFSAWTYAKGRCGELATKAP